MTRSLLSRRRLRKETADREFAERERTIAGKEQELAELRSKAAGFSKELEMAVTQAVKEVTDRLKLEAKNREDLSIPQPEVDCSTARDGKLHAYLRPRYAHAFSSRASR